MATFYHHTLERLIRTLGVDDGMMHIHAGLAIYCLCLLILKGRRAAWRAVLVTLLFELANEAMDYLFYGSLRWRDTASDVLLTMMWPCILAIVDGRRRGRRG